VPPTARNLNAWEAGWWLCSRRFRRDTRRDYAGWWPTADAAARRDTVGFVTSGDQRPAPRPPGSFRIGSVAGIDVYVRASWLIVAALISSELARNVEDVHPGLGILTYAAGFAFAVLLYGSIFLHEMSHALMAKHVGLKVRSISLQFLGGTTEIEGEASTAGQEFKIAVVGPLTSLAVGFSALALLWSKASRWRIWPSVC
jgi:hypothetical protein